MSADEFLVLVSTLLYDGDWRRAMRLLFGGRAPGGAHEITNLTRCLRYITLSMRAQCAHADATLAQRHLHQAQEHLRGGRTGQAHHVIALLLHRELMELDAVRRTFANARKGRQELALAYAEYMTWVRMDPFTTENQPDDQQLLGLDDEEYRLFRPASRTSMCARATRLRHHGNVRRGSLAEKTWDRAGGENGIEDLALKELAEQPLRRDHDLPVRCGRLHAWSYARRASMDQQRSNTATSAG